MLLALRCYADAYSKVENLSREGFCVSFSRGKERNYVCQAALPLRLTLFFHHQPSFGLTSCNVKKNLESCPTTASSLAQTERVLFSLSFLMLFSFF
jgi:hypothetical protein